MSEEEMPPLTNEPVAEGTDIDASLKKAQDERRLNNWYGVEPGKLATDEQMQAMQDHQMAMIQRDLAPENPEDAVEVKPLDEEQEKQAQQSKDLEYLTDLFRESSDKEHQATAWKLFNEFIDKYEMTRPQERALRDHIVEVSHQAPAPESSDDSAAPTEEKPEGEKSLYDQVKELNEFQDAQNQKPEGEVSDQPEEDDLEMTWETSEDKKEGDGSEVEPESADEPEKSEEEIDGEEEKERKSIWERVKLGYYGVLARIDLYFNGGTPEQNRERKLVAGGIAVIAVGTVVMFGIASMNDAHEVASSAPVGGGEVVPHFGPDMFGGGVNPDPNIVTQATTGTPEVVSQVASAMHEHLGGSGDTIWYHAREALQEWGVKPTNANILKLTSNVLKDSGLSWDAARHLPNGYEFVINKPDWIVR